MSQDVNGVDEFFKTGSEVFVDHDARLLRAMRAYLRLDLTQASEAAGVTRETISRAENSRRRTYRTTKNALFKAYIALLIAARSDGD